MEKSFRKYLFWRRAHELALEVYRVTSGFPDVERYGLISQMRRASFSVPTNFVEGYARGSEKELMRFLHISFGSLCELEYGLEFARDIKYLSDADYAGIESKRAEVGYLLNRLMTVIKQKLST